MKLISRWKAAAAAAFAVAATFALAACIISPGKFESTFDVRRDGTFTLTYDGEIHLLALSRLAQMSQQEAEQFVETSCYDEESLQDRPCTDEELAEQRRVWEDGAEERRARSEREAEQMRRMFGGIDPADPAAAEELAARLRRQEGWKRVEHRGDGLFEVEFALSSRFGHDFVFPTMERFPMTNSFVVANRRADGSVRIEAPGFAAEQGGEGLGAMMAGAAASTPTGDGSSGEFPALPEMEGTFRIVTDGQILANNTDEGPSTGTGGQILEWKVNRRTQAAPMALIKLGG